MAKKFIVLNGTMGVGKSATAAALNKLLPASVMLDGDWCWMMDPFVVTPETQAMVLDNIGYLLRSFLRCGAYEHVVFCWVMHEAAIIEAVMERIEGCEYTPHIFTLTCSREALAARLQADIDAGRRAPDIIGRSTERLQMYNMLDTVKVDVGAISPDEAARRIAERL